MKRSAWRASVVVAIAAAPAMAQPLTVFSDADFAPDDWTLEIALDTTGGATVSPSQDLTGGNPDAYRRVMHDYCAGTLIAGHFRAGAVYDPSSQGAINRISASWDFIQFDPPPAQAVGYGLILKQNDSYYVPFSARAVFDEVWTHAEQLDLRPVDFQRVSGAGGFFPDFSDFGAPISLGYYSGNTSTGECLHRDSGIDNWSASVLGYCPADTNRDGSLNVFDFLNYQTLFSNGDLRADFAAPFGVLNVFDFLGFQTAFGNGC